MSKAGAMFYGSQSFDPTELFLMLPESPEDASHDAERDLFAMQWSRGTILIMRLGDEQRAANLRMLAESGAARLLERVKVVDVLGLSWDDSASPGLVDTVLRTLCDVFGGFYIRDGQVLGALGPVPL